MLFNEPVFLFLYLPLVLFGFYVIRFRGSNNSALFWLLGASFLFYAWWSLYYLGLLICSIIVNYQLSHAIIRTKSKAKIFLVVGILANVCLLAYYKYANFFLESLNSTGVVNLEFKEIILPLAISFYTFQQIAYLVDTYKYKHTETSFTKYALFIMFFPQLIAGPIVHHREISGQFNKLPSLHYLHHFLAVGLTIFIIGLFKKAVLADSLAHYVTPIFTQADAGENVTFMEAWVAAITYGFQLYFDFSGYADMAIGLAYMMGFRLPINFFSPYKSESLIEFWRRWHITLSNFLKDYIYIPMGGGRRGAVRRYGNLMATMLIGGLWHGASWSFIVWGGVHGLGLIINHGWRSLAGMIGIQLIPKSIGSFFSIALTFLFVTCAWVLFRAETLSGALNMLKTMLVFDRDSLPGTWQGLVAQLEDYGSSSGVLTGSSAKNVLNAEFAFLMSISIICIWVLPNVVQLFKVDNKAGNNIEQSIVHNMFEWAPTKKWLLVAVLLFISSIEMLRQYSEFLYFQF